VLYCFYVDCFVKVALFPAAAWISQDRDACCCQQGESPKNRGNKKQGEAAYCHQCYSKGDDCFHVSASKIARIAGIPRQMTRAALLYSHLLTFVFPGAGGFFH